MKQCETHSQPLISKDAYPYLLFSLYIAISYVLGYLLGLAIVSKC